MIEYQYLTIECDNCDTPYEVRWDIEHPSAPLTCPFCGHEVFWNVCYLVLGENEELEHEQGVRMLLPNIFVEVKIDFPENWVHLRKSNTEPIIRIYTEAKSQAKADALAEDMIKEIEKIIA